MKLLLDFFPIILFFIAYKLKGIFVATAVAIAASFLQVGFHRWRHGRFETMHLATLGLIVVFGGATLLLEDKQFIMWKPSVVNWLFAIVFLGSHFIGDRPLIQRMMGSMVQLAPTVWRRLNLAWVVFFIAVGLANLYVANLFFEADAALQAATGAPLGNVTDDVMCAQTYSGPSVELCQSAYDREQNWVNFKLFGLLGLTVAFVLLQAFYMARHMIPDEPEESGSTLR